VPDFPFNWTAAFVVGDTRVALEVQSDTRNRPAQQYVSFTGTLEGGGQIVGRLREVINGVAGTEDIAELCDAWDGLHMKRIADLTDADKATLERVQTLLGLVDGERYGQGVDFDDLDEADFSNASDVIDSRDIIKRIETLAGAFAAAGIDPDKLDPKAEDYDDQGLAEDHPAHDYATELRNLRSLESEAEDCGDWVYGATLVRDSYFETFAQEEAESIGAIDPKASWPLGCIDWERAANELKMDYTAVDYDGETYYVRS
jgi:hypothetical protein